MTADHEHDRIIMPEEVSEKVCMEENNEEEESIDAINAQDEAVKEV
tara:strand:- start:343 stop:480 length:138 start_codon:yes stop_codon:yes gene_type:complete